VQQEGIEHTILRWRCVVVRVGLAVAAAAVVVVVVLSRSCQLASPYV
jgi:hypothetical protein